MNVALLGVECRCHETHSLPSLDEAIMDKVKWIHLGFGKEPRDTRQWAQETGGSGPVKDYHAFHARLDLLHRAAALTEDQAREYGIAVKMPNIKEPFPIGTYYEWRTFTSTLTRNLYLNPKFGCLSPPPTLLVCTAEQVARHQQDGWFNAVNMEDARTYGVFQKSGGLYIGS